MTFLSLPARALVVVCFLFLCIPAAYSEESLDIGAMLPQSAPDEPQAAPPSDPPSSQPAQQPRPSRAPKSKALPLSGIRDFDRFQSAFAGLSKYEQLRYAAFPFILYTLVEGSGDEKAQTLRQNYTSETTLRGRVAGWQNLLAPKGEGYPHLIESGVDKAVSCSGKKGKDCRYAFEFIWQDNCWRLRSIRANEPGI